MQTEITPEQEMRNQEAPWFDSLDELQQYINSLVERTHDYGSCAYAMSLASVAAFQYVASKLGTTGFQESCANLDFIRRTRKIEGPFMLVNAEKMLYPQYDIRNDLDKAIEEWKPWAAEAAEKKLATTTGSVADSVRAHWIHLASFKKDSPKQPNNTMQYQIEKNVPMPELKATRRLKTPFRLALEQLEIGDSIAIKPDDGSRAHASARHAGIKVSVRKFPDGTARVWRVA